MIKKPYGLKKAISSRDRLATLIDMARFGVFSQLDADLRARVHELMELRERLRDAELAVALQEATRNRSLALCSPVPFANHLSTGWRQRIGYRA